MSLRYVVLSTQDHWSKPVEYYILDTEKQVVVFDRVKFESVAKKKMMELNGFKRVTK
jgi:hypothetical protein